MVSLSDLELYFGDRAIFDGVSVQVTKQDKIGLVGKNGAGKSTLLKLINGEYTPDKGAINKRKDAILGYLPQEMKHNEAATILQETQSANIEIKTLDKEIAQISSELAERTDYESSGYLKLIENLKKSLAESES